jgi:hypothetical protein
MIIIKQSCTWDNLVMFPKEEDLTRMVLNNSS